MRKYTRRLAATGLAVALALTLPGCGSDSEGSAGAAGSAGSGGKALTKTTVLLDWFPNPDHMSLYAAKDKGYFKEQGLDVTLQSPSSTSDAAKMVSLGQVPLAISYEPDTLVAKSKGLNVTAVAALIPTSLNSLIISGKSGVADLSGLGGKTVGSSGLETSQAFLNTIAKAHGISTSGVKVVNVNSDLIPAIVSGKVDAIIGAYRNIEGVQLEDRGLKPQIYPVGEAGVPDYDELVVIANTTKLKSDPAYQSMVKSFLAGLAKGDAAAQGDPDAAVAALQPVAKGYSGDLLKKMVAATAPLLKNSGGFGAMEGADWQKFADWMQQNGMLTGKLDASTALTTAYLPTS